MWLVLFPLEQHSFFTLNLFSREKNNLQQRVSDTASSGSILLSHHTGFSPLILIFAI